MTLPVYSPAPPIIDSGSNNASTTDRTPTFEFHRPDGDLLPDGVFECAVMPVDPTGNPTEPVLYRQCGSGAAASYTWPEPLANGDYAFLVRSVAGLVASPPATLLLPVRDWTASFDTRVSTTQAGAHPDLVIHYAIPAGQLREHDMHAPPGMAGALTAFPMCPQLQAAAATCPPQTQVGAVEITLNVSGLQGVPVSGPVFLTEPEQPGDAAGFSILIPPPIPEVLDNVIIPLRISLERNGAQMRIHSTRVPTSVREIPTDEHKDYYVTDFKMTISGSRGSGFPLATNPSSCLASAFNVTLGDTDINDTAVSSPFQATGCSGWAFTPSFEQTIENPVAGAQTALTTTVNVPLGQSAFRIATATLPQALAIDFTALGSSADMCPVGSVVNTAPPGQPVSYSFDTAQCPPQARVGRVRAASPLLPTPIEGVAYAITSSPNPRLGLALDAPEYGVSIRSVGQVSTVQLDPECFDACAQQLRTSFQGVPDVPMTSLTLEVGNVEGRVGVDGPLGSDLLRVIDAYAPECVPEQAAQLALLPHSRQPTVQLTQPVAIDGCVAAP